MVNVWNGPAVLKGDGVVGIVTGHAYLLELVLRLPQSSMGTTSGVTRLAGDVGEERIVFAELEAVGLVETRDMAADALRVFGFLPLVQRPVGSRVMGDRPGSEFLSVATTADTGAVKLVGLECPEGTLSRLPKFASMRSVHWTVRKGGRHRGR